MPTVPTIVKSTLVSIILAGSVADVFGSTPRVAMVGLDFDRIVNAIYKTEGGGHTKYPYGVRSVRTTHPRLVCENTVKHAWRDYADDAKRRSRALNAHDFIFFLADRYCPPIVDSVGNKRWKKNMMFFLSRS